MERDEEKKRDNARIADSEKLSSFKNKYMLYTLAYMYMLKFDWTKN